MDAREQHERWEVSAILDDGGAPSMAEVANEVKWRKRFCIFLCLVAFATICGALAGGLK